MLAKLRSRLSYANIVSTICLCLVVGGGSAYAANTVFSADIVDGEVKNPDVGADAIGPGKVIDQTLTGQELKSESVGSRVVTKLNGTDIDDNSLAAEDLASNSVGQLEIQTDGVAATEIADNSIDAGEIVDFGLSNEDVGVLFAQVNADGTLANSSGSGVTSSRLNLGQYEVDFGRNISNCAFVMTQGEAGVGGAPGAITGVTDRGANVEAVFATTRNNANSAVDRAFQLVVVC